MVGTLKATIIHLNGETTAEQRGSRPGGLDELSVLLVDPTERYPNEREVRVRELPDADGRLRPGADYGWFDSYEQTGFMSGNSEHHSLSVGEAQAAMSDARQQLKGLLLAAARFVRRSKAEVAVDGEREVDVPGRTDYLSPFTYDRFELRRRDDGTVKLYARATSENPGDVGGGIQFAWVSAECKLTTDASGLTCEAGANLYINDQVGGATPERPSVGLWDVQDPALLRDIAAVVAAGSKD